MTPPCRSAVAPSLSGMCSSWSAPRSCRRCASSSPKSRRAHAHAWCSCVGRPGSASRELLRWFCADTDKLVASAVGLVRSVVHAAPLGPLLDVARDRWWLRDHLEVPGRPRDVAATLLRELDSYEPTVLVLEDLHCADETTLDVVRLVVHRVETHDADASLWPLRWHAMSGHGSQNDRPRRLARRARVRGFAIRAPRRARPRGRHECDQAPPAKARLAAPPRRFIRLPRSSATSSTSAVLSPPGHTPSRSPTQAHRRSRSTAWRTVLTRRDCSDGDEGEWRSR